MQLFDSHASRHVLIAFRVVTVIEKLFSLHRTACQRFHQLKGMDICLRRISVLLDGDKTELLDLGIGPSKVHRRRHYVLTLWTALQPSSNYSRRGALMNVLLLLATSARLSRVPARFQGLKDGTFSRVVIRLLFATGSTSTGDPPPLPRSRSAEEALSELLPPPSQAADGQVTTQHSTSNRPHTPVDTLRQRAELDCAKLFGANVESSFLLPVYSLTCGVVSNVIQNHPSYLRILHQEGVTAAVLGTFNLVKRSCGSSML